MTPVVTLVGGGVSTSVLLDELARRLSVEALRVRLVARDLTRLRTIAAHGRRVVAGRPGWRLDTFSSFGEAVEGADVVVLMLRVGGLEARRSDELLAQRFGLPPDEGLGVGGAANAMRTLPVVDELARELLRSAPEATVLNLVAPLGSSTRVLLDRGLRATGVCELPSVTERELGAVLGDDVPLSYAGFNHLGWFWPTAASARGSMSAGRFDEGVRALAPVVRADLADRRTVERFGAVPLKYFYWLHDPDAAARLGISRDPDRALELIELRDRTLAELATAPDRPPATLGDRPTPWFTDALVPMLVAVLGGPPWRGHANLRNGSSLPSFDPDVVVEVPATVGVDGVTAHPPADPVPGPALAFSRRVERSESLLHAAWREQDDGLLARSFVEGPHGVDDDTARRLAHAISADTRGRLESSVDVRTGSGVG